jgi:hypothetical protein
VTVVTVNTAQSVEMRTKAMATPVRYEEVGCVLICLYTLTTNLKTGYGSIRDRCNDHVHFELRLGT